MIYENNVASCRIWDGLGFKRIGRIPGAGRIRSFPDQYVDAIVYGRDLGQEGDESVTQDRFDKIRYYLKHAKYPRGADRAEKSRLRSAATHYKLIGGGEGSSEPERLMLKDKEVVSDPEQQYEIAKHFHLKQHAGINKTTAAIAVQYHWVRIKETVSRVIRDCPNCEDTMKASAAVAVVNGIVPPTTRDDKLIPPREDDDDDGVATNLSDAAAAAAAAAIDADELMNHHTTVDPSHSSHNPFVTSAAAVPEESVDSMTDYATMPLDPQIIDINQHLPRFQHHATITDPYQPHGLPSATNFDVDVVRHHPVNDYHMMVDDSSDTETGAALRREALGLVTSQAADVQQEHEILAKYVARSEDDLDFS